MSRENIKPFKCSAPIKIDLRLYNTPTNCKNMSRTPFCSIRILRMLTEYVFINYQKVTTSVYEAEQNVICITWFLKADLVFISSIFFY